MLKPACVALKTTEQKFDSTDGSATASKAARVCANEKGKIEDDDVAQQS